MIPLALDAPYDYGVPEGMTLAPGDCVLVPLGRAERVGVVWPEGTDHEPVDPKKLKSVLAKLDAPPVPEIALKFAEWVARYTLTPLGLVVRMVISAPRAFDPPKARMGVMLAGAAPYRATPGRQKVLAQLTPGIPWQKSTLAAAAGVSTAVVDGLVAAGTLVEVAMPEARLARPDPDFATLDLSDDQEHAAYVLRAAVQAGTYSVSLLDGVTGSGKTEVYFEAVAEALRAGRQVVILLPEIALTTAFIERFEKRFGARPAEWHSGQSDIERGRLWRAVATGEAKAVIGARSALFLPFVDLGLIVVDEEHDQGFKQDERVVYQARDMAVVRGHLGQCPVVLASATPSIESLVNAETGRYRHIRLASRFAGHALPDLHVVDLKVSTPERGQWLSPVLAEAMTDTLARGQQALLFLNRRGYAPLTLCRGCGHRFECPQCTAWLVEHRFTHRLQCHYCGFSTPTPEACPSCGQLGSLVACGPGVERVAEEVRERFPDARLAILSSDHVPNITALRETLRQIADGEADLIIGTQIVAKGHHFPKLSLVGVVDGDLGLAQGGDPRAAERTFQLLHQVTGRAGRAGTGGMGLLQTHLPDHPVIQGLISGDREQFLAREIAGRRAALLPPFGRLASLIVTARDKALGETYARELARAAPHHPAFQVLGPVEAPIAVIRGRWRFRLLVRAPKDANLQAYVRAWLGTGPRPHGDIRLGIDIDPYNFL